MDRAIIFVGREGRTEHYQLLIDCDYLSSSYNGSSERELFFEDLSDNFVRRLLEENKMLEIGTFNGHRINPETGEHETVSKLEEGIIAQLGEKIKLKYISVRPAAIPAPSGN